MRILWHRIAKNPTTRIESQVGDVTILKVEGLMCDTVCAARTRSALRGLEGVRHVDVDLDTGIARIEGAAHDAATYEHAVTSMVAGKPIRRAIESFVTRVRKMRGRRSRDREDVHA